MVHFPATGMWRCPEARRHAWHLNKLSFSEPFECSGAAISSTQHWRQLLPSLRHDVVRLCHGYRAFSTITPSKDINHPRGSSCRTPTASGWKRLQDMPTVKRRIKKFSSWQSLPAVATTKYIQESSACSCRAAIACRRHRRQRHPLVIEKGAALSGGERLAATISSDDVYYISQGCSATVTSTRRHRTHCCPCTHRQSAEVAGGVALHGVQDLPTVAATKDVEAATARHSCTAISRRRHWRQQIPHTR
mmetsp:Transcript_104643/g.197135  ORF Transcript_104643/g.197135 Transcript_104643/m.197135 type:complete len:248 (-) Transcript_104643:684-1427(-)